MLNFIKKLFKVKYMLMYEVRKNNDVFYVYDRINGRNIAHTQSESKANNVARNLSSSTGFQGEIPTFFIAGQSNGINLD